MKSADQLERNLRIKTILAIVFTLTYDPWILGSQMFYSTKLHGFRKDNIHPHHHVDRNISISLQYGIR